MYGTRYILRFDSEKYNNDYKILVKEKDYTGQAENKSLGAAPLLRRDDSDSGISGTSLELAIQADVDGELTSLYTVDNKKFLVELYRNSVLVWRGYVLPEKYSEPYIAVPYDVTITASDGLGILKDIDFGLSGERTIFEIIKHCCDQTSLLLDFEVVSSLLETSMNSNNVMHVQARLDASIFSGKTCYEVLESCMTSLDSFITQHENRWLIARYTDLSGKGFVYSNAGAKISEKEQVIGVLGAIGDNFYPIGNLEKEIIPASKSTKLSYDYGKKPSFLANFDFANELNGWDYTTTQSPARVKHFTHDGMGFVRITGRSANGGTAEEPNYIRQTINVEKTQESLTFIISHAMGKGFPEDNGEFNVNIKLACDSTIYYLTKSGWGTTNGDIVVSSPYQSQHLGKGDISWVDSYTEFKILANGFPGSGRLTIQISNPVVTTQYRLYINKVIVTNDVTPGIDVDVNLNSNASTSHDSIDIAFGDTPVVANAKKLFNGILWTNNGFTQTWTNGSKTDSFLYTILKCVCSRIGFPRQQLSGTIQGENLRVCMLTRDKYSNLLFYIKEASLNLLTDEMDCTLEQFMPYSELSGETSESARTTGNNSEYRSSGDNETRVYQSGAGVPMRIRDLSPVELQPDSVIEVDRGNAPKSGKATLQTLLEFIKSTGDVWTKEELQFVEGYILYLGEKIKAGFADNSELWAEHRFSDYLNQFLLTTSDVEFASILTKILTTNEITTPDFVSGLLGSGARLKDGHLELNEITVRQRMNIFLLVYQKAMHQGGLLVLTPWGAEITEVIDGGSYYKCKYDTKGGKIIQPFILDDLLLCQTFDSGNSKRYWRRVTSVGDDYFNLSKTDCEANSGIPTPGDEVFVFGNKTNVARQKALVLCAVGDDAPYYDTYEGINSFSLDGKLCTREGNLSGIVDEVFGQLEGSGLYAKRAYLRGKFALDTGENIGEKITDLQTQINAVPGQIEQSVGGVIDWTKEEITDKIAKAVVVTAQSQVFKYAAGYTGTPTPASILLTATAKNFTPVAYQWQYFDSLTWKDISGATGATYSVVPGNTTLFPGSIYVRTFRCVCDGNLALSDEFTLAKLADGATGAAGKPGADAYTVLLTNEAHTVAGDASGNPLSGELAKAVTKVIVYKGVTAVAFTIQNLVQEGGVFAVDGTDGVKCTSLSSDSATCTFEVNVGGIIIKKAFGVTKSKTGATGKDGKPGAAGKGVTSIVEQYYLSTSSTTQTGGSWVTTPPAWVDGRYFWTQSVITYTDGSKSTTPPVCVSGGKGSTGGTGATGATGNGISKVDVLYYLSTSATALSGGTWETTAPTWEDGKYMWSKTKVTYTNGTVVESAAACITGGTGATGRGISSTAVTYQASTSGTTVPTGTWVTSIPTVAANQYLWTRTVFTYTDSTTSTSYSIGKVGATGATGATGKGVKSTAVTYQASTSGTTVPTGTWSSSIPSVAANSYLWTRTIITYTDNTTSVSYSIGKMGATGAAGKGVASVVPQYYLSTSSTTTTGGSWSNTIPAWTNGKYIWTRLVTTYTDNSTTTTSPVYDIANMAVDVAYSKVQAGINNLANGITIFAKQTDFNALGTRVGTAEATIKTQANNIELKVSKNGVVAAINASPESVKISAAKIDLVGKVTFSMLDTSAQNTINGKITSAQATSIASGQVATLKNSLKSLAYLDKIEQAQLGTTIIEGGYIKTSLIRTDLILSAGAQIGDFKIGTVSGTSGNWLTASNNTMGLSGSQLTFNKSDRVVYVGSHPNETTGGSPILGYFNIGKVTPTLKSTEKCALYAAAPHHSSYLIKSYALYAEVGSVRILNGGFGGLIRSFSLSGSSATIDCNFLTGHLDSISSNNMALYIQKGFEGQKLDLLNYTNNTVRILRNDNGGLATILRGQKTARLYYTGDTWLPVMVGDLYNT